MRTIQNIALLIVLAPLLAAAWFACIATDLALGEPDFAR